MDGVHQFLSHTSSFHLPSRWGGNGFARLQLQLLAQRVLQQGGLDVLPPPGSQKQQENGRAQYASGRPCASPSLGI